MKVPRMRTLRRMCGIRGEIGLGTTILGQGRSGRCGGHDEECEVAMIQTCEEEMYRCPNEEVRGWLWWV